MLNANEFFEIVGELYYGRFRRLRPGKSVSPFADQAHESYEENVKRFQDWVNGPLAFNDAVEQIAKLQDKVRDLESVLEDSQDNTQVDGGK